MSDELAIPESKNKTNITLLENDAEYAADEIFKKINDGVDFMLIGWDMNKMKGQLKLTSKEGELNLFLPNKEALFNLQASMATYYLKKAVRGTLDERKARKLSNITDQLSKLNEPVLPP